MSVLELFGEHDQNKPTAGSTEAKLEQEGKVIGELRLQIDELNRKGKFDDERIRCLSKTSEEMAAKIDELSRKGKFNDERIRCLSKTNEEMAAKIAKLSSEVSELRDDIKLLIHALLGNDKRTVVSAGVQTDVLITDQNSKSMNAEDNPRRNDKRSMEDTENIPDSELNMPPTKLIKTQSLPLNPRHSN